jgi:hypothetical protein
MSMMASTPNPFVREECLQADLDTSVCVWGGGGEHHKPVPDISMLVPHQVVWHKSVLSNVTRHLILEQHSSVLALIAWALHFTTVTNKI